MLLDKIYKFEDKTYELGGAAASGVLDEKGAYAVHTTCYEQKAKVMGLKVRCALGQRAGYCILTYLAMS